jgi:nitrite reductase (NO-forming)
MSPRSRADGPIDSANLQLLTRRDILRRGSLIAGSVGAATVVAACTQATRPAWSFAAAAPPAAATPSVAASMPAASPGASAPAASAGATPAPSGTAASPGPSAAAPSGSPAAGGAARDPSPAAIATPPPYRPRQAAPIEFSLDSFDGPGQSILIAPGKAYGSMNFAGQVPAPTLRVTEGDVVHFTLTNRGAIPHSIDFHAARTPWDKNYQTVPAGQSFSFEWTATAAGVFMYHCGATPVIMHIADGMFGTVIVDPKGGRAPAREYLLERSEFYGSGGDYEAMMSKPPDVVAFNGQAFRYKDSPLPVTAGELLRVFLMNAGPNDVCAFHVIGALISHYEQDGNPANAQGVHQSVEVLPGGGALVELTIPEAGLYPFMTHRMSDMERGAMGLFKVT